MKTSVSKILGLASLLLPAAAFAANTSVTQPEGLVDLTTSDATKAFSTVKPNAKDWLAYNLNNVFQYYLDYTHAFDDGGTYDRTDRCILSGGKVDFGYSFDEPTVVNAYKIYLPKDDGISVNERAPGKWTFEGSNDKTNWEKLDTRGALEVENNWGATREKEVSRFYSFDNTTAFKHYRLNVSQAVISNAGYVQLAELEFFNTNAEEEPIPEPIELDLSAFASHQTFKLAGLDEGVSHENLPVLVRFDPSAMTFVRADHKDLAFTQGSSVMSLPYEVDTWTESQAMIWVCIPQASRGTSFSMHWGAEDDYESACPYLWPGYAKVIHFNGLTADSEKYAFTDGMSSATDAGRIGGGASGAKTTVSKPFGRLSVKSQFAASLWARPTANDKTLRIMSTKVGYKEDGFEFIYVGGTGLYIRGNGSDSQIVVDGKGDEVFPKDTWTHYTAVVNGSEGAIYLNGRPGAASGSVTQPTLGFGTDLSLGGYRSTGDENNNFSGTLDEFRLYNGVPTAARVKAEYQAMADENFLTTGIIASTVEVESIVSSDDERKVTVEGAVHLGDDLPSLTVVIGVGTTDGEWTKTYEIADLTTGPFTKEITDLDDGLYYVAVGLKDVPGSWSPSSFLRVGAVAPIEWTGAAGDGLWATPGNWDQLRTPTVLDVAILGSAVAENATIALAGEAAVGRLEIRTTAGFTLSAVPETTPSLKLGGLLREDLEGVENNQTFVVPLVFFADDEGKCRLDISGSGLVRFNANLSKDGVVTLWKTGNGELDFCKANTTWNGTVRIFEGKGRASATGSLHGTLEVGGGETSATFETTVNEAFAGGVSTYVYTNGYVHVQHGVAGHTPNVYCFDGGRFKGDSIYGLHADLTGGTVEGGTWWSGGYTQHINANASDIMSVFKATFKISNYEDFAMDVKDGAAPVDLLISGTITEGGASKTMTKRGPGTLKITGACNAAAQFKVTEGKVYADSSSCSTGTNKTLVNAGCTLGGTGRIGGTSDSAELTYYSGSEESRAVCEPGTVDPETGAHVYGTLTVGSEAHPTAMKLGNFAKLMIGAAERNGETHVSAVDKLQVYGSLTIGENAVLDFVTNTGKDLKAIKGGEYEIIRATGGITGDFSDIVTPAKSWKINKVMGKVTTEEGEADAVVALTATVPGSGFVVVIQ